MQTVLPQMESKLPSFPLPSASNDFKSDPIWTSAPTTVTSSSSSSRCLLLDICIFASSEESVKSPRAIARVASRPFSRRSLDASSSRRAGEPGRVRENDTWAVGGMEGGTAVHFLEQIEHMDDRHLKQLVSQALALDATCAPADTPFA